MKLSLLLFLTVSACVVTQSEAGLWTLVKTVAKAVVEFVKDVLDRKKRAAVPPAAGFGGRFSPGGKGDHTVPALGRRFDCTVMEPLHLQDITKMVLNAVFEDSDLNEDGVLSAHEFLVYRDVLDIFAKCMEQQNGA